MVARRAALGVVVLAGALAAGGCEQQGAAGSASQSGRVASTGATKVPDGARRVRQTGALRTLNYRPATDGTIYVQDTTSGRVVYSGPVKAQSNVVVDPAANSVAINDQQARSDAKLDPTHDYSLFFVQK